VQKRNSDAGAVHFINTQHHSQKNFTTDFLAKRQDGLVFRLDITTSTMLLWQYVGCAAGNFVASFSKYIAKRQNESVLAFWLRRLA